MAPKYKRWHIATGLGAFIVLCVLVFAIANAWRAPRASYQGRSAEAWLGEIFNKNSGAAFQAFDKMGTNAYPTLVRALRKRDSVIGTFYEKLYPNLPAAARRHLPRPMPQLLRIAAVRMVFDTSHYPRVLLADILQTATSEQGDSFYAIESMVTQMVGPGDTNAIPVLIRGLQGTNYGMRAVSAVALGNIGPDAKTAIPALTNALTNAGVGLSYAIAGAIWQINRDTNTVLAVYRNIVDDPLSSSLTMLKKQTAVNLSQFDPPDPSAIPVLIDWLEQSQRTSASYATAATALGRYGSAAREAVPVLTLMVQFGGEGERRTALSALRQIDPDTAGKYESAGDNFP